MYVCCAQNTPGGTACLTLPTKSFPQPTRPVHGPRHPRQSGAQQACVRAETKWDAQSRAQATGHQPRLGQEICVCWRRLGAERAGWRSSVLVGRRRSWTSGGQSPQMKGSPLRIRMMFLGPCRSTMGLALVFIGRRNRCGRRAVVHWRCGTPARAPNTHARTLTHTSHGPSQLASTVALLSSGP